MTQWPSEKSVLEEILWCHMKAYRLPIPCREFGFHPDKRWRFDFAWPEKMIAVEIEGGIESHERRTKDGRRLKSRHLTPQGFKNDCEKYNEAQRLGWKVYRFSGSMVRKGDAASYLSLVFAQPQPSL